MTLLKINMQTMVLNPFYVCVLASFTQIYWSGFFREKNKHSAIFCHLLTSLLLELRGLACACYFAHIHLFIVVENLIGFV